MVLWGVVKYQADPTKLAYCGLEEPGKGVHVKPVVLSEHPPAVDGKQSEHYGL